MAIPRNLIFFIVIGAIIFMLAGLTGCAATQDSRGVFRFVILPQDTINYMLDDNPARIAIDTRLNRIAAERIAGNNCGLCPATPRKQRPALCKRCPK